MPYFYCPNFNPIILTIGPISLHWYGAMYVLSFVFAIWFLKHHKCFFTSTLKLNEQDIEYLFCLVFLGVLIGGRVGYAIFYQWSFFSQNLLWVFKIWQGGMSFHGGLIGVIISIMFFSYCKGCSFFKISDLIIPVVPFGLGLGRLGNFINGELWGRVTVNVPWAMLFNNAIYQDLLISQEDLKWRLLFDYYGALPRHPSQLYEMFLEGIVLFLIINLFIRKLRPIGSVSGLFLTFYGLFRILAECFRQPDSQLGLINNIFTLGQILSFPMVLIGVIIIYLSYKSIIKDY